jgi:hypothetical protein
LISFPDEERLCSCTHSTVRRPSFLVSSRRDIGCTNFGFANSHFRFLFYNLKIKVFLPVAREGFEIVTGNRQHSPRVVRSAQKATASHDHHAKQTHHEATSSNSHHRAVTHIPKTHQSQHKKESAEAKDAKTKPKMNRPVKTGKKTRILKLF